MLKDIRRKKLGESGLEFQQRGGGIKNDLNIPPLFMECPKLYIPSTLKIDLIMWHTQLNVCA